MTQITPHEETIDGKVFVVHKLPPLEAQDLLIDILNAVSPAVGAIGGAIKGDDSVPLSEREVDGNALAGGIGALVRGLDKKMMRSMVDTLANVSTVDGMKLKTQLPIVFREDLALMYKWLWFALGVQYRNFLELLPSGVQSALGKVAAAATSPSDSGGDGM